MSVYNYEPIMRKIRAWIDYDKHAPKSNYSSNPQEHDAYRSTHDLDCIIANGDLNADTIFSLWIPLRFVLVRINGYPKLRQYGNINDKIAFLEAIADETVLRQLLPDDNETVAKLIRLFDLGQQACNVMILKNRSMQSRGAAPYYDYMPYFLSECFAPGAFSKYFQGDSDLTEWIRRQKLEMFFDGAIVRSQIIDLAGTGQITNGVPDDMNLLLDNYIGILEQRKARMHSIDN